MSKTLLDRRQTYRIQAAYEAPHLVGQKGRPVLSAPTEEVRVESDGYIYDLQMYMLSGKQKHSVIDLPPCKLRPVSESACRCGAYKFPHAPGLGQCKRKAGEEVAPEGLTLDDLNSLFTEPAGENNG